MLTGEVAALCLKADGGALAASGRSFALRLRVSGRPATLDIVAAEADAQGADPAALAGAAALDGGTGRNG